MSLIGASFARDQVLPAAWKLIAPKEKNSGASWLSPTAAIAR